MKVLVLGSGGREHCITWKISKSKDIEKYFVYLEMLVFLR